MVDITGAILKPYNIYLAEREASTDGVSMVPGLNGAGTEVVAVLPLTLEDLTEAGETPIDTMFGVDINGNLARSAGVFTALSVVDEGGATQFRVENNLNAVNNWMVQGGISGSGPVMVTEGTDTDVTGFITAKGNGSVEVGNGSGGIAVFSYGNFTPETDDATALGSSALKWSDLFLASGAVINFSTNMSITHSASLLTINGSVTLTSGGNLKASASFTDGAAGVERMNYFRTGTSTRFQYGITGTAESGGNVGSDFVIYRYTDAGAFIDIPFTVVRSNGNIRIRRLVMGSPAEYAAVDIANVAHALNTTGKETGLLVWDTTNHRMMRARAGLAASIWDAVDGSVAVTPA